MAAGARGLRAMRRHPLAHRQHRARVAVVLELRHVRRRRRRRRAEQVLENPLAAHDRRRAVGIRRHRQDAALAEQPAARAVRPKRHAPEVAALDVRDAVVPREPLVDERVVGAQQVERAAVLAHDARRRRARSRAASACAQRVVEVRETALHRHRRLEVAQIQPLAGEVRDERVGARVRQHPPHLRARAPPGRAARRAPPASSSSSSGMLLHRKNESRDASSRSLMRYGVSGATSAGSRSTRNRNSGLTSRPLQRRARCRRRSRLLAPSRVEREQRLQVRVGHRPAVGAARQRREDLVAHAASVGRLSRRPAREDPLAGSACRRAPVRVVGPADLDAAQVRAHARLGDVHAGRVRPQERQPRGLVERRRSSEERDATSCSPAFTGTRTFQSSSASIARACARRGLSFKPVGDLADRRLLRLGSWRSRRAPARRAARAGQREQTERARRRC